MALRDLLVERQAAICERWLDAILRDHGAETAARWSRERDPFANPVRHALASGLPTLLEAISGEGELPAPALAALETIVKIRSVQALSPSRAVAFVLPLRDAARAELAGAAHAGELATLDARVERLLLAAFDAHAEVRERMFRLRQAELKRSVASILRRWNGGEADGVPAGAAAASDLVALSRPAPRAAGR